MNELAMYYTLLGVIGFFTILFVLVGKYFFLGIRSFIARMRFKSDAGVVLVISKNGDINKVLFVDFSEKTFKIGKDEHPLSAKNISSGRFLGYPYVIVNSDDASTTANITFNESDKEGKPIYVKDANGNIIVDKDGDPIPKIHFVKKGAILSGGFISAMIKDMALTQALEELFKKNSNIFMVLIGAAILAGVAAFFSFDLAQNQVPLLLETMNGVKNACVGVANV